MQIWSPLMCSKQRCASVSLSLCLCLCVCVFVFVCVLTGWVTVGQTEGNRQWSRYKSNIWSSVTAGFQRDNLSLALCRFSSRPSTPGPETKWFMHLRGDTFTLPSFTRESCPFKSQAQMMQVYDQHILFWGVCVCACVFISCRINLPRGCYCRRKTGPTLLNNDGLGDFEKAAPGVSQRMCCFELRWVVCVCVCDFFFPFSLWVFVSRVFMWGAEKFQDVGKKKERKGK